jgi:hypothetical protein
LKCEIDEWLTLRQSQVLRFLDLINNQVLRLEDLTPFKLPLRGRLTLLEEGNVLLQPSCGVVGSTPHFVMPSILDHLKVSYQLDTGTVGLHFRFA